MTSAIITLHPPPTIVTLWQSRAMEARQAHNLKADGSSPSSAPTYKHGYILHLILLSYYTRAFPLSGGLFVLPVMFMKDFARKFYNSKKWKCCRSSFIAERINADGGLCQVCHERTGYIVHHKIALDSSNISKPEIALNHDNLMYVCKECHDEFEGHFNDNRPSARLHLRVTFDKDGEPAPR